MPELPIYQQQYQQSSRRSSAEDFGAIEGAAKQGAGNSMQQLGGVISGIEARKRNRKDTIERVRAINEYAQKAEQERTRMTTEEDLTDTDAPVRYSQFLKDRAAEVIGNHTGSEASKAELTAQIEQYQGTYSRNMYKESTSAQFKVMGEYMDTAIKGMADMAGDMPDTVDIQFQALDIELEKMSAALTPEQEQAYREQGRSEIIKSSLSTYMSSGDYESAEAILAQEGVSETLSPDANRQLKGQIILGKNEQNKTQRVLENKINAIESVSGVKLTATQKMQLAGVSTSKGPQTVADKIAEYESVTGQAATPEQIQKFYKIDSNDGSTNLYGNSLRGRALSRVDDELSSFESGLLSEDGDNRMIADIMEAYGPQRVKDPVTGMLVQSPGVPAPPHVKRALEARGMSHVLSQSDQLDQQAISADPNIGVAPLNENEQGLWELMPGLAGPVAAIEGVIEGAPFIGGLTEQDKTRATKRITGLQRNVVTALQNNPKYAEGERNSIQSEVDLLPGLWSNPENALAKIIAVDENLESRQNFALSTMNDRTQPVDVRKSAANIFNLVNNVRSQLNLPPTVTPEEAAKLPPGTQFITEDGRVMRSRSTGGGGQ